MLCVRLDTLCRHERRDERASMSFVNFKMVQLEFKFLVIKVPFTKETLPFFLD